VSDAVLETARGEDAVCEKRAETYDTWIGGALRNTDQRLLSWRTSRG
jgi:hypothetical protein